MIKIKRVLDAKINQAWPVLRSSFDNCCRDLGVEFVSGAHDVLLLHKVNMYFDVPIPDEPTIMVERIDAGIVISRREIKLPRVIGVIKNVAFRDRALNNAVYCCRHYHYRRIVDSMGLDRSRYETKPEDVPLTDADMDKIRLGWTIATYEPAQRYYQHEPDFTSKRAMDVNFCGTTAFVDAYDLANRHRQLCVSMVNKLKGVSVDCAANRKYTVDEYERVLRRTKIVVAPWGLGEACLRDYEAFLCGCVLLKPDTSFIVGSQDVYQNGKYYIACKEDFSDIQERVDWIMNNWASLLEMRLAAWELCRRANEIPNLARHFVEVVKGCLVR